MEDVKRSPEQIKEHYELEKKLAKKLKQGSSTERLSLYKDVYKELFQSLPHHPQYLRKESSLAVGLIDLVNRLNINGNLVLEIGAGDCRLSIALCKYAKQVFALDVSNQIRDVPNNPKNFNFVLINGIDIPLENDSVDIVISNQLIEHLHPDDVIIQLKNLHRTLKVGGRYLCITPSKYSGPHDISKYFDQTPMGFHLKEYGTRDLVDVFKESGFKKFYILFYSKGLFLRLPVGPIMFVEKMLSCLPYKISKKIASSFPFSRLFGNFLALK